MEHKAPNYQTDNFQYLDPDRVKYTAYSKGYYEYSGRTSFWFEFIDNTGTKKAISDVVEYLNMDGSRWLFYITMNGNGDLCLHNCIWIEESHNYFFQHDGPDFGVINWDGKPVNMSLAGAWNSIPIFWREF
ncbi:hypothetical protein ACFGVR_17545 [Mucilaginibacter sp. AW1-3]